MSNALRTDAELLALYLREGCENSFTALVRAHERMVLGTALRRTGDAELARDVAQQVFALLARKGAWLVGHACIAGWLHQTACYLGMRVARNEARARARHEVLAQVEVKARRDEAAWAALDEELSALGEKERAALVMHYFEDCSYPEMAALLGVSEGAVRQRVSRGLQSLGGRIRRRGVKASAKALLLGVAGMQAALSAPEGLAAAALSSGAISAPSTLLFTTIMSHTAVKLTIAAIALAALPIAILQQTHVRLLAERAVPSSAVASSIHPLANAPEPGGQTEPAAVGGDVLAAWNQLRDAQSQRREAEEKLGALQREIERVETEVVVSYGQIEDLAHTLSEDAREMRKLMTLHENANPAERERFARELTAKMKVKDFSGIFAIAREAQKMEAEPEKAARFYATILGDLAGLDEAAREPLIRLARERFAALGRTGLVASRRPQGEDSAWMESRRQAFRDLDAALLEALPEERRAEAKTYGGIFDLTGADFCLPGTAGEVRK